MYNVRMMDGISPEKIWISSWQVGFLYDSVVEDYFTGFRLHCNGWTSVYCDTSRPQFLGSGTTNLNEVLIQGTRWSSGLIDVGFSKFCPLIYGPTRISILGSMCYGELAFFPLYCLPLWCFATIPQLCLLNGIPLYPKVRTPTNIFNALSTTFFTFYMVPVTGLIKKQNFVSCTGFKLLFCHLCVHICIGPF